MEQSPPLKIIQLSKVEPLHETASSSSLSPPTSLPLTFFDLLWLRFPPGECLFFYEFQNSTTSFYDSLLPNLKHSLSLTLQHFLPFAGNITWPLDSSKPFINYVLGDAVSFTVAESSANFNLLSSNLYEAKEKHHFIPHLAISHEKASLIAIQVTLFPNIGFCIGITTHHAALDGKSSTCFIKSWAYICSKLVESPSSSSSSSSSSISLSSLPENLTPFFDRSVIKDPTGISEVYADAWLKHEGPSNRSLKLWGHFSKMQENAVKGQFVVSETEKLLEKDGFISALEGMNEALNKVKDNSILKGAENWVSNMFNLSETKLYSTAGSPRFDVYSADFGWGKPKKVEITSVDKTGAFSLCESKNNNRGVEIGLVLNKPEMETFSALFVQGLESL